VLFSGQWGKEEKKRILDLGKKKKRKKKEKALFMWVR
jgi:hypothetical protein